LPLRVISTRACRFRKLDSSVSMMQSAKDRIRNNLSEPLDCTPGW
jgi:hypothetical protein